MEHCKTCKHWLPSEAWDVTLEGLRKCARIAPRWIVQDRVPEAIREGRYGYDGDGDQATEAYKAAAGAVFASAGAVVNDGSQYYAELLTHPGFGCTLHEII